MLSTIKLVDGAAFRLEGTGKSESVGRDADLEWPEWAFMLQLPVLASRSLLINHFSRE